MLSVASDTHELHCLVCELHEVFAIMDLGEVANGYLYCTAHNRAAQMVSLGQTSYIETIVYQFNLENTHEIWTPTEHKLLLSHTQFPDLAKRVEEMATIC